VERVDGTLVAGLPVATVRSRLTGPRLVAVPFSDRCDPIYRTPGSGLAAALSGCLERERTRRGLGLEIHGAAPDGRRSSAGDRFFQHIIRLDDGLDTALSRVHRSKLRAARRSTRLGVRVTRRSDHEAICHFFRLHTQTRRRQGVPTQRKRFFQRLLALFEERLGFVLLAEWEGRVVAAALYLQFRNVLTYKYGASDSRHLSLRANCLIFLEAMRHACEADCESLDLGRTELDNAGLRSFKNHFGSEEQILEYAWLGRHGPSPGSVRSVSSIQKTTIRRSPPIVGRAVGAALYRHFG
jgi:hypothetical protein